MKLKFKTFYLLCVVCSATLYSCKTEKDEGGYLYCSTIPTFPSAGGSDKLYVQSNVNWTAKSNNSRLTISPTSGRGHGTITVRVQPNTDNNPAQYTVTIFNSKTGSFPVHISQEGTTNSNPNSGSSSLSTPTNVKATVSGSNVSITWSAVSGASKYNVYRCATASGDYSQLATVTGTSAIDANPLSGSNYYKVSAANNSEESNLSSYANVSVSGSGGGSTSQKPSVPTNVSVSNEGNNYIPSVVVRWTAVSGAQKYYVYKSTSASGSYSKLGETIYTAYTDANAPTNGNSAYYKVKAVNSAGESALSNYAKYTSMSNDAAFTPATPTVSVSGTSTISISWTCATGNTYGNPKSFEVYKRNPATSQFELQTTTTSRSYSDRAPHPGINRYGIIAINDAGKSSMGLGYSTEVPLSKPSSFSASKYGSSVSFTWSKVANATGYQISSSSSANGTYYILKQISDVSTTSQNVYYPASSGTTEYFKIRAYWQESSGGSIIYSDYTTYKSVTF